MPTKLLLKKIITAITSILFVLVFSEITLRFWFDLNRYSTGSIKPASVQNALDEESGLYWPNLVLERTYRFDGKNDKITAHITNHRSRLVPVDRLQAEFALIFFGCSWTFGRNVEDSETIPYFVGEKIKNAQPYNFGVNGGSSATMLSALRSPNFFSNIKENGGIVVYFHLPFHNQRFANTAYNDLKTAEYYFDSSGNLLKNKRSKIDKILSRSTMYTKFIQPLTDSNNDSENYRLLLRTILNSNKTIKTKSKNLKFIVISFGNSPQLARDLKTAGIV
ncbi:MAG: hypothetical protein IT287_03220, partial [Bdellovibrionaceae bacterium]|nr:hypothetical protein [Pseudobdellovibrionaceae bacterium]